MRVFIFTLSLYILFGIGAFSISTAQNSSYFVTKYEDTNDGLCNEDCSLREAIATANESLGTDLIIIPNGLYQLIHGQIVINDHLVITGSDSANTIIDGNGNDRIFFINPDYSVQISGVTLLGGIAPCGPGCDFRFPGGGVYNLGSLTVVSSVIRSNIAGSGGGIYNGGKLSLDKVIIINNISAIGGSGGGIFSSGSLDLTNCEVKENNASSGGGIYQVQSISQNAKLIISDSVISSNQGSGILGTGGGGIVCGASTEISNSTISFNSGDGGILFFGLNETDSIIIRGSTIAGNSGIVFGSITNRGGGITHRGGVMNILNSTISGNSTNGSGGGIAIEGGLVHINNATITDNTANIEGNGIATGGGIFNLFGIIHISNSILQGNLTPNPTSHESDCQGELISEGYNLIGNPIGCNWGNDSTTFVGVDPKLGVLRNNGGSTFTHALLPSSPMINAGNPAAPGSASRACELVDQRGITRPQGFVCDIGAYETNSNLYLPIMQTGYNLFNFN